MLRLSLICATATIATVVATTAVAHHSIAAYQNDALATLTGSVVEVDWTFPHVYIHFDSQKLGSEEPARWLVEGDNPAMLRRVGLNRDSLQPGDAVTLTVRPPVATGNTVAFLVAVDRQSETLLDMRKGVEIMTTLQNTSQNSAADSIDGVWAPILVPGSGVQRSALQLTAAGQQAAQRADSIPLPESVCAPTPIPMLMFNPAFVSISVTGETVELSSEAQGMRRIVRLDTREHSSAERSLYGESVGWWEGNTLVVETSNFLPHPYGLAIGVPSSEQKRFIERFALSSGGRELTYSFELTDGEYLANASQGTVQWQYRSDIEFDQPACK